MAAFREGTVASVTSQGEHLVEMAVDVDGRTIQAVGYLSMIGSVREGDRVVVNMTGLDLQLGTGGLGFVLWNLDGSPPPVETEGHIIKLRYTPWQMNVTSVEAPESASHQVMVKATSLDGTPVVTCGLHSQLPAAAAGIKAATPGARVGYLMTDGGALALRLSRLVNQCETAGLVDSTCTSGHAFGGDLESVNIFSGLLALHAVAGCDAIVSAIGPGVVGTGTLLGHTGMEAGQVLDAATALQGRSIAALRISFADDRERHAGLSHHSIAALTVAARERATVVVPSLDTSASKRIGSSLEEWGIGERHDLVVADGRPGLELMRERGITPTSMGRSVDETPELWLAAAAAGAVAAGVLQAQG